MNASAGKGLRLGWAVLLFAAWLGLFILGSTVGAGGPYVALQNVPGDRIFTLHTASLLASVALTWTWSNCLLLCLFAALLGGAARADASARLNSVQALHSAGGGFFVYLCLLAGQLVSVGELLPPERLSGPFFVRIAVLGSGAAFIVGYRPKALAGLLKKASERFDVAGPAGTH